MSTTATKVTDNTHEMSFHELFSQSTQVTIPLFQREYVWTEKQLIRLYEEIDIVVDGGESNRFLGAVIAVRREANPATPQVYEIVDGQQRLSTLYLFVLAAAQVAAKNKYDDYARGLINSNLIIDWWQDGVNTKLVPSFSDRAQFVKLYAQLNNTGNLSDWLSVKAKMPAQSGDEKGKLIRQYDRMRLHLQKRYVANGFEHLKELVIAAQTKLTFVFILLKDASNATTVFAGLNDPGIPIDIGDLVRNEVFSSINDQPGQAAVIHRDVWLPFRNKMGDYFNNYFFPFAIIHSPSIKTAELFRGLRDIWGKDSEPKKIIQQLETYVNPYLALTTGKSSAGYSKKVNKMIAAQREIGAPTSTYPFLMKLLKQYELQNVMEHDVVECFEVLESFLVRRAISGIEPTGLLVLFRNVWTAMKGHPTGENLKSAIKKRTTIEWPDDQRLKLAVNTRGIYKSNISRYAVLEFERSLGADFPTDAPWIEHILPQKKTEEWAKNFTDEEHQSLVHTWGNLIPLTAEMNIGVSQSAFQIKKAEIAKGSMFASARKVVGDHSEWTPSKIRARNTHLGEWAAKRWKK